MWPGHDGLTLGFHLGSDPNRGMIFLPRGVDLILIVGDCSQGMKLPKTTATKTTATTATTATTKT